MATPFKKDTYLLKDTLEKYCNFYLNLQNENNSETQGSNRPFLKYEGVFKNIAGLREHDLKSF